jgi:hypothetical protein
MPESWPGTILPAANPVTLPAMNEVSNTTTTRASARDATIVLNRLETLKAKAHVPASGSNPARPAGASRKDTSAQEAADAGRGRGQAASRPPLRWGINE